jgi:hypothetical protein
MRVVPARIISVREIRPAFVNLLADSPDREDIGFGTIRNLILRFPI